MTAVELSKAALPHRFAPQPELFREPERAFSPSQGNSMSKSLGLLCALGRVDSHLSPGQLP